MHEMLILMLPRVLSRVSGFPVASLCLWGKLQKPSFSKVYKQVVMSFCVAGATLCDIPTCLITRRKSLCVAGAILLRRFQKMRCSFRGRRSALDVSIVILRGKRSTPHSTLHSTPHPHFTLRTPHSTLHTLHFTLHTLHSTLYTLHFTLRTPHSTLQTLHSTLHTSHSTVDTLHSTLHTLHFTLHTPHYTLNSTLYTPHFTLQTPHSTLYTSHSTLNTLHFTLPTLHCTLHTPHFNSSLHSPHTTHYIVLYSTL